MPLYKWARKLKVELPTDRGNVLILLNVTGRSERCFLQDVLHVPEFEHSLVSVSAMDVRGIDTLFGNGRCEMMRNDKVVATRTLNKSSYTLYVAK